MTTKFGVCNVNAKKITLALQAICYSKEAINYLIVHELSHLVHPHHQKSF
jgi:predicted metal-dependent hydrolase